MKLSKNS